MKPHYRYVGKPPEKVRAMMAERRTTQPPVTMRDIATWLLDAYSIALKRRPSEKRRMYMGLFFHVLPRSF